MTSYTQKSDFIHHRMIKVNIGHLQLAEAVSGLVCCAGCRVHGFCPQEFPAHWGQARGTQSRKTCSRSQSWEIRPPLKSEAGRSCSGGGSENPAGTWRRRNSVPGAGGGPAPGVWPSPGQRGRTQGSHALCGGKAVPMASLEGRPVGSMSALCLWSSWLKRDLSKLPSADPGEGSGEPAQAC